MLDVRADLDVTAPGGRHLTVRGDGRCLKVELPRFREGLRLLRLAGGRRTVIRRMAGASRIWEKTGLSLDVAVRQRTVVRFGCGVAGNWAGRLLGLPSADLRTGSLILAGLRL
ncbi:MAG: hypothetical protein QNJ40_10960 [Xanthomonadales bacterium]|nr:hypothetical protein [Xanthomonadales bacterium]